MAIKITGDHGFEPIRNLKKSQKAKTSKETENAQPTDRVKFSNVLQEVNEAQRTLSSSSVERAEKVQALKEQVASGNYQPDLRKVAASLLRFLVAGR